MADTASGTITVEAEPAAVMGVIADFPAYPQWAGNVKTCEVTEPGEGPRAAQVHFVIDAGVVKDDYELRYTWEEDRRVSWDLVRGRIQKAQTGSYSLEAQDGSTLVTYELSVDLAIPMIGMFKRKAEKVIIDTALKDLKRRVEQR